MPLTSRHSRPFSSNSCISHTIASTSPSIRDGEWSHPASAPRNHPASTTRVPGRGRPPRTSACREGGPEPSEVSHHDVEDLGEVAEEGPEDVAVAAELKAVERSVSRDRDPVGGGRRGAVGRRARSGGRAGAFSRRDEGATFFSDERRGLKIDPVIEDASLGRGLRGGDFLKRNRPSQTVA